MFKRIVEKTKPHFLPLFLLLTATFAVYAWSLGHDFLINYDDDVYVTANEAIRGATPEHLRMAFTSIYGGNYAPFQIVSYMLDYAIWGMRPAGFILTNIICHALNGILFYWLLLSFRWERLYAFLAAAIFLLHPVQVESVVWISQRKNLLSMLFFLAALHFYLSYRDKKGEEGRRTLYVSSVACFILSLLAKSVAVVLPPILFLYDFCFPEKDGRKWRLADKIPYILAAAAVALAAIITQKPELGGGRTGFHGGGGMSTFLTMLPVFARYLGLLFWPADLSAIYTPPIKTALDMQALLAALLICLLFCLALYLYRRRRPLFFWLTLFFVGLLPVSQIVPLLTLMNDRYLYFPMLGGAAFLVGCVRLGGEKLRRPLVIILCIALIPLSLLSERRARVWKDSVSLLSDTVKKAPESYEAWSHLINAYWYAGKLDAVPREYLRNPHYRNALRFLGVHHTRRGAPQLGRFFFVQYVRSYPDDPEGYLGLADNYMRTGELESAERVLGAALALQPGSKKAQAALDSLRSSLGRPGGGAASAP